MVKLYLNPKPNYEELSIDHTKIASDLTDFVLYVKLANMSDAFWAAVANGGGDIRCYASDGTTELAREVVSCDTTAKTGELWVKVPAVSASVDTVVFIAYGSGAADYAPTDTYGSQAVWGASAKFVGHFDGNANDSSASGNNGTVTGATQVDGEIGKAYDFAVLDTDKVVVPNMAGIITQTGIYQISCRVYLDATGTNRNVWLYKGGGSNRHNVLISETNVIFNRYNGSAYTAKNMGGGLSLFGGWHTIVAKNNGGDITLKVDGVTATSTSSGYATGPSGSVINIGYPDSTLNGSGSMDGKIDEFRVMSSLTSDDYDAAEYANQSDPEGFYSVVSLADITSSVQQSLRIDRRLGQDADTCDFEILSTHGITPQYGDDVDVYEDSVKVFGGEIKSVSDKPISGAEGKLISVRCSDYTPLFDSLLVSKTYENETVADIISDIVSSYAPGFTTSASSSYVIPKIVFNQVAPSKCIQRLADSMNYDWYVDENKDVKFFAKFAESAPFDLGEGNAIPLTLQRTEDGSQVANRVKIRGGEYDGDDYTDSITVSGSSSKSFKLPYRFADLTVTLNTVAQAVGVDFIDDFTTKDVLYNYQEQTIRWETALTDADVITFTGKPKVPVFVVAEDSDSIASYGAREKLIRDTSIVSNEVARRRALAELYSVSEPVVDMRIRTYTAGLEPGMSVRVNLGGRDEILMVKSVSCRLRDHTSLMYDLNLVSARRYGFLDLMRKAIGQDDRSADESEVSEQIFANTETATVIDSTSLVTPEVDSATATVSENYVLNPFGANTDATYVLSPYVPTSQLDTKRPGRLDISMKLY